MVVLLRPKLQNAGVEIFTARIVNFDLKEENEEDKKIIDQYLETWRTNLRQKITQAEAEVNAIYRQELEQAHAYAKSALLETVAESLENARRINTKLPRHVIAQYYIHALDEYIKKQPGLNDEEIKARVESLQQVLLFSREGND
jgi:vacuolar-type H+-ATPase subunit E/Vma4